MIKVAVCTPHGGKVSPLLYRNIFSMQQALQTTHEFTYVDMELASVHKARNMMVQLCLDSDIDLLHFVDDDVLVPENVVKLYEANVPIISGLYISRQSPHLPQMYMHSPQPETKHLYVPVTDYTPNSIMEVDAVGGGCLLVQTEVFRKLDEEWRKAQTACADALTTVTEPHVLAFANMGLKLSPWFEFLDAVGEDFYFCERAIQQGYRVLVDTSVKCTHLGTLPFSEAHFLDARARGLFQIDDSHKVVGKEIHEDRVPASAVG